MGLKQEIKAAQILRAQLAELGETDPDLVRDMIEAETGLHEMLTRLALYDAEDGALVEATAQLCKDIAERKGRIEKRIETRRALMLSAMQIGELRKLETPAGTLSLRAVPAKCEIVDESMIPSKYFTPQPPKLNKKDLLADLKVSPTEIPGAALSNGGETISVRR